MLCCAICAMLLKLRWKADRPDTGKGLAHLQLPFVLSNILPHLLLHLLCAIYPQTQGFSECLSVKGLIAQVSALKSVVKRMLLFLSCNDQNMPLCGAAKALLPFNLQSINRGTLSSATRRCSSQHWSCCKPAYDSSAKI